jgi:alkylated DNA repair dioxygenase AlkB
VNTLFPIEPPYPPGFTYQPAFISLEDEQQLIDAISKVELHQFVFQGYIANRRVASFGYDYSFDKRALSKGKDIPADFHPLVQKVSDHLGIEASAFAELLVIEYPVGAVINWHRDAPPFDIIAGISLQSDCTFRLRPQEKEKQTRSSIISIPVQRRSLYVMQGSARSEWQHSTAPAKQLRYSITLRTLRNSSL